MYVYAQTRKYFGYNYVCIHIYLMNSSSREVEQISRFQHHVQYGLVQLFLRQVPYNRQRGPANFIIPKYHPHYLSTHKLTAGKSRQDFIGISIK